MSVHLGRMLQKRGYSLGKARDTMADVADWLDAERKQDVKAGDDEGADRLRILIRCLREDLQRCK